MVNGGGFCLLKILRIIFLIIAVAFAGYGLFTKDFQFQGYMMLFLGLTTLVSGIQEFKRNKKIMGWLLIGGFALLIFVSIQSFMWIS